MFPGFFVGSFKESLGFFAAQGQTGQTASQEHQAGGFRNRIDRTGIGFAIDAVAAEFQIIQKKIIIGCIVQNVADAEIDIDGGIINGSGKKDAVEGPVRVVDFNSVPDQVSIFSPAEFRQVDQLFVGALRLVIKFKRQVVISGGGNCAGDVGGVQDAGGGFDEAVRIAAWTAAGIDGIYACAAQGEARVNSPVGRKRPEGVMKND